MHMLLSRKKHRKDEQQLNEKPKGKRITSKVELLQQVTTEMFYFSTRPCNLLPRTCVYKIIFCVFLHEEKGKPRFSTKRVLTLCGLAHTLLQHFEFAFKKYKCIPN